VSNGLIQIVFFTALVACATVSAAGVPEAGEGSGVPGGRVPDNKCGLAYRLTEAGLADPAEYPAVMAVPSTRTLFQSDRTIGGFRFHYDTTGADAPALLAPDGTRIPGSHEAFVDSAGAVFNAVREYQTAVMGYADPVQASQTAYDVYIYNSSYYGETVPETRIGMTTPARYVTHINIDNDFRNFYSSGIAGLKVTAAHEFFHAVQFGSYGYWNTDGYFMELTSTWMEDAVFGEINDYYQYVRGPAAGGGYAPRGQFARPDFSLLDVDGLTEYSRAIFGKFLEKKYSPDVIRRAWELVPAGVAIRALDAALGERGSSFREAFLTWAVWNANTGPEADTTAYYAEGKEYPRIVTAPVVDYTPPGRTISDTIGTVSAFYYPVTLGSSAMAVIVANVLTAGSPARAAFRYEMADAGDASYKELANGLHVRLDVPDPENWSTIESSPAVVASVTPAPNPFLPDETSTLRFQIPAGTRPASVSLTVLSAAMERIFQGPLTIRDDLSTPFVQLAEWDGRDNHERIIASGIYIYVLEVDGTEHTGKFAVVR
jgi:hypothetical protein